MGWGWVDEVFTAGSKSADELGSYSIKLASDLAPYGIKNLDNLAALGIKNSDELLTYIKNSDIGKLAFSNTLKNPPSWLRNIIPPNLTANLSKMGIKNLDDIVKLGFKNADDLKKLGIKNSNDLVKVGIKNADDLVKIGIKNADDLVKVGIKNADDLVKVGIKNADDLAKVGIKNADDLAKFGMKSADDLITALNKAKSFGKTLKNNWKTILAGGALTVGGVALFSEGGREAIVKPLFKEMANVLKEILGALWESIPEEFKQYATFLFFIIIGLMVTQIVNAIFTGNMKTLILVPMWLFIFWSITSEWTFNEDT